jgi:cyanophycinase
MRGPVALVGAGEFLPVMTELDRQLLAVLPPARPRVAILPTASWPDGEAVFRRWGEMGIEHFRALGAEVEAVPVRERVDAWERSNAQAVGEADLVYLSGGKPEHLMATLAGSPVWEAVLATHARGGVLAGCSAGAMVLCSHLAGLRRLPGLRFPSPFPARWEPGLGVVPGMAVLPHYDAMPEAVMALWAMQGPSGAVVLGIDEDTALVGRDGVWQVHGESRVTVWRGRHRERLRAGDVFRG